MKEILKKLSPVTFALLTLSTPLVAKADSEMRLSKVEAKLRDSTTSNARGTFGAKLAEASPNIDGYGFYISADACGFKLFEDNNSYAVVMDDAQEYPTGAVKNHSTNFSWDWGVKAGLGYYAEHDNWQTGFEFTYFKSTAHSNIAGNFTTQSQNTYEGVNTLYSTSVDEYTSASDHWDVYFYNLDWKVGRDFFVSKYLSFLPEVGVKASWIYQNRQLSWSGNADPYDTYGKNLNERDQYTGVGPKADVVAKLWLGRHFSVIGGVDVALLFATNKAHYNANLYDPSTLTGNFKDHISKNHISPYLGMKLGVAYDTNFSDDAFNLGLKLTYEQQYYNKASRLIYVDTPSAADLAFQAIDFGVVFSF